MMGKAPKGGITSMVNGQYYEGGQFTPDHGKYCGKGKNNVTEFEFDEFASKAREKGLEIEYNQTLGKFRLLYANTNGRVMYSAANLKTLSPFLTINHSV